MPNKPERIIIDTNLWISFLINKQFIEIQNAIFKGEIILVFSYELLNELGEVLGRPKFNKYFTTEKIIELIKFINNYCEIITVVSICKLCRDEKDNFLLSFAIDSNAHYLLTGDNDLLELKKIGKTKIINITTYLGIK